MNIWEQKIRIKESEIHTDLFVQHKNGTKSPKPNIVGYLKEDAMLSDYMVWLNNTHTDDQIRRSIFHIENEGTFGGKYGAMQGAISKGKGKKKGVLDVCSVYMGNVLFMEFKLNSSGTFSDEQLDIIGDLQSWSICVFVIRSFDFFKFCIEEVILKGLRLGGGIWVNREQIKNKLNQII